MMGEKQNCRKPPELSEESIPRRAIELIFSLIVLSHSSKVFTAKWQSIRNKLTELSSSLSAVENCLSGEDSSLSGEIFSILETAYECHDTANRCVNLSYSGKLLMQSDIDVMCSKFDIHVRNLSEIVQSGILIHQNAIVVVKPGTGSCKDDIRFYIRDLLTRLNIGDTEMKIQALISLNELIIDDEKQNVKICMEIDGFISILINFLDSSVPEMRRESANLLFMISGFELYKDLLIGYGVISPLIRVLESGDESGKTAAGKCLMKLTANSDNVWSFSAHGGVTVLLKICNREDDYKPELIGISCTVLKNLAGVEEIKRFMVEEGAISILIRLARSENEVTQICSIELLQAMAFRDESVRQIVIRDGGIRVLVHVFDPKSSLSSSKTREMALKAIDNLCFSSLSTISVLMNYGFLDHLLYFLRYGEISVQELALKASFRLCDLSDDTKKAMGEAGFMTEFIKFIDAKSYEVREMAAEALYRMILVPKNRRKFVQEDGNIGLILKSLAPEEKQTGGDFCDINNNNRKLLLSTLVTVTNCSSGRKKIVNSGYMKNIEKLAEAEVTDAKRIVKKLSTNRFRSMINGLWHFK